MRRHVLIVRFGPLDSADVAVAPDEVVTRVDLVASQRRFGYGIGDALDNLKSLGLFPSEMGFDVLVIAASVHAADTRLSRSTESQDKWTREIRIALPVSDEVHWAAAAPLLKRMLNFLTGDRWSFTFRERPNNFVRIISQPQRLFGTTLFKGGISLFSGGLDSLIGTIDILQKGRRPILVSHAGEGATSDAQRSCIAVLKDHYGKHSFNWLRVWMNFPANLIKNVGNEDTTRGRSFLFIALAVFVGTGLDGHFMVNVPENGLIALNVPLDPLRLGSLSTRTTHPFYMARWNELLGVLGVDGQINNPYWNKTKGEMVAACENPDLLAQLIPKSLSCASPAKGRWHGHGIEHCGYCVPCLIRRAALNTALGHGNDPTTYTLADLTAGSFDTRQSEGQQIRSFQLAIERLASNASLANLLIHKPGPLADETPHLPEIADVYRRGMAEVAALLAGVKTRPS